MSTTLVRSYRGVLREINKSAIQPRGNRNQAVAHMLRSLYETQRQNGGREADEAFERGMMEVREFVKAQRTYNELLLRYNPLHDMSPEERVNASGRRVGLDKPVQYSETEEGKADKGE
ncbi:hypothetical protein NCC49_003890 [Naganishia albida]|nr:hypothetical protein NCC49_003890 [Naganishia albida]